VLLNLYYYSEIEPNTKLPEEEPPEEVGGQVEEDNPS
jgi:hypothetical protein